MALCSCPACPNCPGVVPVVLTVGIRISPREMIVLDEVAPLCPRCQGHEAT